MPSDLHEVFDKCIEMPQSGCQCLFWSNFRNIEGPLQRKIFIFELDLVEFPGLKSEIILVISRHRKKNEKKRKYQNILGDNMECITINPENL